MRITQSSAYFHGIVLIRNHGCSNFRRLGRSTTGLHVWTDSSTGEMSFSALRGDNQWDEVVPVHGVTFELTQVVAQYHVPDLGGLEEGVAEVIVVLSD